MIPIVLAVEDQEYATKKNRMKISFVNLLAVTCLTVIVSCITPSLISTAYDVVIVMTSSSRNFRNETIQQQRQYSNDDNMITTLLQRIEAIENSHNEVMDQMSNKINDLESQVKQLNYHREMAWSSWSMGCDFIVIDNVCQLHQPLLIGSSMNISGDLLLEKDLNVDGSTTLNDSVHVNGELMSTNTTHLNITDIDSLYVQESAQFNSEINALSDVIIERDISVAGRGTINDLFVPQDVEVYGKTSFQGYVYLIGTDSYLNIQGDVDVGGFLTVSENTTLHNMMVTGLGATIDGTLVTKNLAVTSTISTPRITVNGAVTADSVDVPTGTITAENLDVNSQITAFDLDVDNDVTLNSLSVNGDVNIDGDLNLKGKINTGTNNNGKQKR